MLEERGGLIAHQLRLFLEFATDQDELPYDHLYAQWASLEPYDVLIYGDGIEYGDNLGNGTGYGDEGGIIYDGCGYGEGQSWGDGWRIP